MNFKEIEKIVSKIQHHIFKNSNSFSIGVLKSHFRGSGLQFKEHQVYTHGDDVRFIDWKLTAKSRQPYIKTFEEERNVEITVVIDFSETMLLGHRGVTKIQASIEIACLIYLLAAKTKDKVRVIILTEKTEKLPLSEGHAGIVILISRLEKLGIIDQNGKINMDREMDQGVSEKEKIGMMRSLVARRKKLIWLTDFQHIENQERVNTLLMNENMYCFRVLSPLEKNEDQPYSIWSKVGSKAHQLVSVKSFKPRQLPQGKWKELNVKDRYLENFVKEIR